MYDENNIKDHMMYIKTSIIFDLDVIQHVSG